MLPEIIDAHVHPFIQSEDNTGLFRYGGPQTPDEFVNGLKRAGITKACGSVIRSVDCDDFTLVRQLNDDAIEFGRMFPDFFVPGVHIHPLHVDDSCREIERVHSLGVKLVGELVPYMMGYDLYFQKNAYEVYELMQSLGMVLSIHPTTDEDLESLMRTFPHLTVIVAHPGEKPEYEAHLDRMSRYENAFLDICGTGLFRNNLLRYGIDRVGYERFIFGTDYPICNPAMQVHGVLYEDLTDNEIEAILAGNFHKLMNK